MEAISNATEIKRAYCLYRVSTKKQVDKEKNDIPMQKIACHEFAQQQGWVIAKEFYEKGISGFKVSANDRDAIQDLKEAAVNKEFDVLLVYMFDRLGRRDDETPFVVEWFAKNGIEVWSTQEGQQRFENQTDKLLNYIRYWQANGESVKTSIRLKTRMAQLTAEGIYHGGPTPLGYRAVNLGRVNKKGQPVKDLQIDEKEAEYVRIIFNKTLNEGYGSYRMAQYLNERGVRTHTGGEFQCNAVNRILRNRLYCGYYVAGETTSPKMEHLVIIDENVFDNVQEILQQRSLKNEQKKHIARTTKGKSLLSGNIYCAHCGGHLTSTENHERYIKKLDGTVGESRVMRYMCYHRARRLNDCDGQSIYAAKRVDAVVLDVVRTYLSKIKETPKNKALEIRYKTYLNKERKRKNELLKEKEKLDKRLYELSLEVGKSLCGENQFPVDVLAQSIKATKEEIQSIEAQLSECEADLAERGDMLSKLDYYYQQFASWADEFETAGHEQKKMIICQLIDEIKVGKGYEIGIKLNASYGQFFAEEQENIDTASIIC